MSETSEKNPKFVPVPDPVTGLYTYGVTLTIAGGFSAAQVEDLAVYCKSISNKLVIAAEHGAGGNTHLHICIDLKPIRANNVTRRFIGFYADHKWPVQTGVSVVVKHTRNRMGWLCYIAKEVPMGSKPLVVHGYQWGEIKKALVKQVKAQKAKDLKGTDLTMNMDTAPARIIAYAKSTGVLLTDKEIFCRLMASMMRDGYLVHRLKPKVLFAQVMCKIGYERFGVAYWENELAFA